MIQKKILIQDTVVSFSKTKGDPAAAPLVFLHGWGADKSTWFSVAAEMKDFKGEMFFVDLPGFGESEMPRDVWGLHEYVEVVREFLEKECFGRHAVLIGHSFGGQIAIALGSEYKKLVKSAVLVSAAAFRSKPKGVKKLVVTLAKIAKPLFSLPGFRKLKPLLLKRVTEDSYRVRPEMYETMKRVINTDLQRYANNFSLPTLLIWGEEDEETPLEEGRILKREIRGADLVIFEGSGHFPFFDNPRLFAKEVLDFVGEENNTD